MLAAPGELLMWIMMENYLKALRLAGNVKGTEFNNVKFFSYLKRHKLDRTVIKIHKKFQ